MEDMDGLVDYFVDIAKRVKRVFIRLEFVRMDVLMATQETNVKHVSTKLIKMHEDIHYNSRHHIIY